MNSVQIKIRQGLPIIIIAFIAGYFFKWVTKGHSIPDTGAAIWLSAFATISVVVIAFVLGERQAGMLWRNTLKSDESAASKKRASFWAIATAAYGAVDYLEDRYHNTHEDRLRLRVVYQGDAFAGFIEALAAIPIHELETVEAVVALVGLKKTMLDAKCMIDVFIAAKNKWYGDALFPNGTSELDLRTVKSLAQLHYQMLVQTLRPEWTS